MSRTVRLGCFAAFWGDAPGAAAQILRGADVDYLVADYLSEITMALLARARAKNPDGGFVAEAVDVLRPLLPEIRERGIRVVTNAGALNPAACARAFEEAAREAGVEMRVAAVEGDDLLPDREAVLASHPRDMFTGESIPDGPLTMNAYLGARPIAAALAAGADIVITGRCVDSAVALGPLMHEFGWGDDDHDLLSAGSLVGHIIECGPQCTGGTFTDWDAVPGWEDMGFPVAECNADGTAVITKPSGTGGLVTRATVGEQMVYEIGDPGAYVMPDVVCDWREVRLEDVGPDRVRVSGARGRPPTTTYKATVTQAAGHRALTTAMFAGADAGGRARRAAEALVARAERIAGTPFDEASVEVIGAGDTSGPAGRDDTATEVVVKIGVRHARREPVEIFAAEFAPMALVAQGMTGFFAGRPRVAPVIRVLHLLTPKAARAVRVRIGEEVFDVDIAAGDPDAVTATPELADAAPAPPADAVEVPLRALAWARSGDKGDQANIGVIARRPEYAPVLREQLTPERVADRFAHCLRGPVRRWEIPGIDGMNFVLDAALGGTGGTSTLRYDAQGKSFAAMLLEVPVAVPQAWVRDGALESAPPAVA